MPAAIASSTVYGAFSAATDGSTTGRGAPDHRVEVEFREMPGEADSSAGNVAARASRAPGAAPSPHKTSGTSFNPDTASIPA